MSSKRLTVAATLLPLLMLCGSLHATGFVAGSQPALSGPLAGGFTTPLLQSAPAFNLAAGWAQTLPEHNFPTLLTGSSTSATVATAASPAVVDADTSARESAPSTTSIAQQNITDLRKALLAAAMSLRDTRYVRGGSTPATGFDCSGFVRYVFAHAIGLQLPSTSATQFLAGVKIKRSDIKPGDLVFFRTHGRHSISHVGIYISDGRFIHSPTTGKTVEISSLDDSYWAKRFAGAKRPEAMALATNRG